MRQIKLLLSLFLFLFLFSLAGKGSDLYEVLPLNSKTLILHFKDGYIKYHGYKQSSANDIIVKAPLDVEKAALASSFYMSSDGDEFYLEAKTPVRVGRKSKPMYISQQNTSASGNFVVYDHWIYLELPQKLVQDTSYTLWVGDLADNMDEYTFTFNEFDLRSPAIKVNQLGYKPSAGLKFGYLAYWMGDMGPLYLDDYQGTRFYLANYPTGEVVYEGTMDTKRKAVDAEETDNGNMQNWAPEGVSTFFGSDVWEVDFSDFDTPGEYVLVVEGIGRSYPFKLDEDIYREAYYHTTRFLFVERSGIAKEEQYMGKWAQPRDHHPDDIELYYSKWPSVLGGEGSSNKDNILDNLVGQITGWGWGWYHDAGDWDGYVTHTRVPRSLLAAYELNPENFADGELNIPESGNGIPDILDEAGWLINYFRRNQRPEGGIAGGRVHADWLDHPDAIPSYDDPRPWYVCGEDPQTSYLFAGLACNYAFCLELAGVNDSTDALVEAAKKAYEWANDNYVILGQDLSEVEVNGENLVDLKAYAAASIYKITGEQSYLDDFKANNKVLSPTTSLEAGDYNQKWSSWAYITSPNHPNIDGELKGVMQQAAAAYGKSLIVETAKRRSTRVGYNYWMPPITGSTTTPRIIEAMYAHKFASGNDKDDLYNYMHTTADYFLGSNPMNILWITGIGDRAPKYALHLDSRYDHNYVDEVVPGIVPYGPLWHNDWMQGDNNGWWDADFAKMKSYPDRFEWPISEFWFDNKYSVADGEFTVHQNIAPAAAAYGFLSDSVTAFSPNKNPEISIVTPSTELSLNEMDALEVEVNTSDDEWIDKVEFYLDHHIIARSTKAPFTIAVPAIDLMEGEWYLNALAFDNEGRTGRSDSVMVTVTRDYAPEITYPVETDTLLQGESVTITMNPPVAAGYTLNNITVFINGQLLGSDESSPYEIKIDSILPRTNTIKAVANFAEGFSSFTTRSFYAKTIVTGVTFESDSLTASAGEFLNLPYSVIPPDAENQNVSWTGDKNEVATVDPATGLISVFAEGQANIVITTEQGNYSDTLVLVVLPPPPMGPYHGSPFILPGKFEAEDYDLGGEGIAFHDETPGNSEGEYRNEAVDIGSSYDEGAAYHVTGIDDREWLNYSVLISESNFYNIRFRYTAGTNEGIVKIKLDDKEIRTVTLPVVGWYPFEDYIEESVYLEEGDHVLQFYFEEGPYTFNYFEITCEDCSNVLPSKVYMSVHDLDIAVGGTIQLGAAVLPAEATNKEVYWESTDDEVIYVGPFGKATALKEGAAQIIVTTKSRGLTDTCDVNVLAESSELSGIKYEYFEGEWDALPDFESLQAVLTGSVINFDITNRNQDDNFAFRFTGNIVIPEDGVYSFYTASDDGSRLFIDGTLVADNDGLHASQEQGGSIELDSGLHQIEVQYFEKGGGEVLEVRFEGPGYDKGFIPDSLLGRYVVGGDLVSVSGIGTLSDLTIKLDEIIIPSISILPENASDKKYSLESSDDQKVSVLNFGALQGIGAGTADITVTTRDGGYSDSFTVTVINDNPIVQITAPTDQEEFWDEENLEINVTASDTIGGIRAVYFYGNDELIDSLNVSPYNIVWEPTAYAENTIKAVAYDFFGFSAETQPITIFWLHTGIEDNNALKESIRFYPNPFDETVSIWIKADKPCNVRIEVFNVSGVKVLDLKKHLSNAGVHSLELNATHQSGIALPDGLYYVRTLISSQSEKITLHDKIIKMSK